MVQWSIIIIDHHPNRKRAENQSPTRVNKEFISSFDAHLNAADENSY